MCQMLASVLHNPRIDSNQVLPGHHRVCMLDFALIELIPIMRNCFGLKFRRPSWAWLFEISHSIKSKNQLLRCSIFVLFSPVYTAHRPIAALFRIQAIVTQSAFNVMAKSQLRRSPPGKPYITVR